LLSSVVISEQADVPHRIEIDVTVRQIEGVRQRISAERGQIEALRSSGVEANASTLQELVKLLNELKVRRDDLRRRQTSFLTRSLPNP
jgi:hypothetical protein